ncbi:MAG: PH domain-containing protein [bacterium]|nr:PH domain-containing protein [bacterium]
MDSINEVTSNAKKSLSQKLLEEVALLLVEGEAVLQAFNILGDVFAFTDQRLILIDKQWLTGKKVEYLSLPYRSITLFSVETAGALGLDSELKIWVSGTHTPIKWEFPQGTDIVTVQRMLAEGVLRKPRDTA